MFIKRLFFLKIFNEDVASDNDMIKSYEASSNLSSLNLDNYI